MEITASILNSLVTLLAGSVALFLYRKQKADSKADAANVILSEIQNAERVLREVDENVHAGTLPPAKVLLPTESWSQYKYLFVRDFDRNEWDTLSRFYSDCRLYDDAVKKNNSFFDKNEEQIRIQLLGAASHYLRQHLEQQVTKGQSDPDVDAAYNSAKLFQDKYLSWSYTLGYSPIKPITDAKNVTARLSETISLSSVGTKLKAMARFKGDV